MSSLNITTSAVVTIHLWVCTGDLYTNLATHTDQFWYLMPFYDKGGPYTNDISMYSDITWASHVTLPQVTGVIFVSYGIYSQLLQVSARAAWNPIYACCFRLAFESLMVTMLNGATDEVSLYYKHLLTWHIPGRWHRLSHQSRYIEISRD